MGSNEFIVTPGAGGVGAVVAALVVGASAVKVSRDRQGDARLDRAQAKTDSDIERWWERFVWLLSAATTVLPIKARFLLVCQMAHTATRLAEPDLIHAVAAYRNEHKQGDRERSATDVAHTG